WVKTDPNAHGLYKVFPNRPTHDPEDSISLEDMCRSPDIAVSDNISAIASDAPPWFPFLNSTVARLMTWFHLGSNIKSNAELESLVNDVLLQDDYDQAHLQGFSAMRENRRLDDTANMLPGEPPSGWKSTSVKIKLPMHKSHVPETDAPEFEVPGILYRPLLDVLTEAFQSPEFMQYHLTPFECHWDPNHDPENGHHVVYGEIYTSAKMLKAHSELPRAPTPHLETIIAAYMFWSDSTHLANFGNASLWPLYTFFGNLSPQTVFGCRSSSSLFSFRKSSFILWYSFGLTPYQLPDSIKDFYRNLYGVAPSAAVLSHLKRELMHAIWDMLLTPEFIHAYIHGIAIKCYDGVERLVFPRFFTYGAAYPEKYVPNLLSSNHAENDKGFIGDNQIFRKVPMPPLFHREGPDL
ncbi:hypothetical protein DFH07DRAFT_736126, partial [Mycena maculata]